MMNYRQITILCSLLLMLGFLTDLAAANEEQLYPGHMAWEIKPGGVWEESPMKREVDDGPLYEEVLPKEGFIPKKPENTGDLYGLNITRYYLCWNEEKQWWMLVDMMGVHYARIQIFYSPDRAYSRQRAVEKRNENNYRNSIGGTILGYKWSTYRQEINIAFKESWHITDELQKLAGELLAERGGYSLVLDVNRFIQEGMKDKEVFQLSEAILAALNGDRKFGYFPKRTKQLEKKWKEKIPGEEREPRDRLRSMREGLPNNRYLKNYLKNEWSVNDPELIKLAKIISIEIPDDKRENGWETAPNINRGVGALKWIRKHLDIPFVPEEGLDESHLDLFAGKFTVNENGRNHPIRYRIMHLNTKGQALRAMFAMQCGDTKPEILKQILRETPRLVGDEDMGLQPIMNELGQPIPHGEQSWISFIRGNTAVMLKNEEMQISVLPLAKKIDEALLKNLQLFMKPEEIR